MDGSKADPPPGPLRQEASGVVNFVSCCNERGGGWGLRKTSSSQKMKVTLKVITYRSNKSKWVLEPKSRPKVNTKPFAFGTSLTERPP